MFKIENGRLSFYQWDINQRLIIEDPSITEVHFCNRTSDCSLVCTVYEEDGKRFADVPNILLQSDWTIKAYAYSENRTLIEENFIVYTRTKPADYIYSETEVKTFEALEKRINQIEEKGISEEALEGAIERYFDENDIDVDVDLTGYATEQYVDDAIANIDIPSGGGTGGGAEKEWKRIGLFTAADNINPWIIDADENGNPFACTEFRILAKLCWFQKSTNSTANRSIEFLGDNGKKYGIALNNLPGGFAQVVKGEDVSSVTASYKHPCAIDITTHAGLIVAEALGESTNNMPSVMMSSAFRNRGVPHNASSFSQISLTLGYPTNLVMAGSTLEIWGR